MNFFIRHLQKVHKITEFEEIRDQVLKGSTKLSLSKHGLITPPKYPLPKKMGFFSEKISTNSRLDSVKSTPPTKESLSTDQIPSKSTIQDLMYNINILCMMETSKYLAKTPEKKSKEKPVKEGDDIKIGKR